VPGETGYWKITDKGIRFVFGQMTLPRIAYVYDNELLKYSDDMVTFKSRFEDKFSYEELMEGVPMPDWGEFEQGSLF
jgi:hypothetical protein